MKKTLECIIKSRVVMTFAKVVWHALASFSNVKIFVKGFTPTLISTYKKKRLKFVFE